MTRYRSERYTDDLRSRTTSSPAGHTFFDANTQIDHTDRETKTQRRDTDQVKIYRPGRDEDAMTRYRPERYTDQEEMETSNDEI